MGDVDQNMLFLATIQTDFFCHPMVMLIILGKILIP